ncbi:MAG: hypothetical protein CVU91_06280 [Firmicutes bacterium HGW-Firmicutes-16]|nr:MAG: hypothetical protein CVU91_06280 [Firmicutes bacterium HGW-Firmicutes-16]
MGSRKDATKKKILEVTAALLESAENPENITVREIADAAGVGIGLINYHFGSRDRLIKEALSTKIASIASIMEKLDGDLSDPVRYLKEMLVIMSDVSMKDRRMNRFSAEYELTKGDLSICLYLLPILREIYKDRKSETELRLIAFQIIATTQSIYLRQDAFHMLTGIDIENKTERDHLINMIVDDLIK